jgi:ADP-ribose pyrophosphatase YjhB (NUDIX family)
MKEWLKWAMELQSIAQIGLTYSKDKYDIERFKRIREISAEILSKYTDVKLEKVRDLFCNETGYQTPKIDTRSAIFEGDKILLVKENGEWSLPGGWGDINLSVMENTKKEVKEETGLIVEPERLIAIQDHNKNNIPIRAYSIYKIFVLCKKISGQFEKNIETEESNYFSLDNLPKLSLAKNTKEQIEMCFKAHKDPNWKVLFD